MLLSGLHHLPLLRSYAPPSCPPPWLRFLTREAGGSLTASVSELQGSIIDVQAYNALPAGHTAAKASKPRSTSPERGMAAV